MFGGLLHDRKVSRGFPRHCDLTVIPEGTRFDALHHAAATVAFQEGVPGKVVLVMLGRSSIEQTLDMYCRVVPGMRADAVKRLDPALF